MLLTALLLLTACSQSNKKEEAPKVTTEGFVIQSTTERDYVRIKSDDGKITKFLVPKENPVRDQNGKDINVSDLMIPNKLVRVKAVSSNDTIAQDNGTGTWDSVDITEVRDLYPYFVTVILKDGTISANTFIDLSETEKLMMLENAILIDFTNTSIFNFGSDVIEESEIQEGATMTMYFLEPLNFENLEKVNPLIVYVDLVN